MFHFGPASWHIYSNIEIWCFHVWVRASILEIQTHVVCLIVSNILFVQIVIVVDCFVVFFSIFLFRISPLKFEFLKTRYLECVVVCKCQLEFNNVVVVYDT